MKRPMKPIEAIYEDGRLRPLEKLPLKQHQHVWMTILSDRSEDLTVQQLGRLAAQSPSFRFLADPAENLYSLSDGQPV